MHVEKSKIVVQFTKWKMWKQLKTTLYPDNDIRYISFACEVWCINCYFCYSDCFALNKNWCAIPFSMSSNAWPVTGKCMKKRRWYLNRLERKRGQMHKWENCYGVIKILISILVIYLNFVHFIPFCVCVSSVNARNIFIGWFLFFSPSLFYTIFLSTYFIDPSFVHRLVSRPPFHLGERRCL